MSRETSPFVVGEYWLDKRRDGRSPDVWQIARYDAAARCDVYRSTRKRDLEEAKGEILAYASAEQAKAPQQVEEARVIPLLFLYWTEHGQHVRSPDVIAYSIRQFIGFLMQDEASPDIRVAKLTPSLFERFRRWRMGPHESNVPWRGKVHHNRSKGVKGESVQRNIEDIRAALAHHVREGRIIYVPPIPSVKEEHRSDARDLVLTREQMGAMIGFVRSVPADYRWVALMVGTAMRPEAALKMDPAEQWLRDQGLLDLHPVGAPRTKKRNPVIPAIPELVPVLEGWPASHPVASKKRMWRTMRRAIGLPEDAVPKTIRHTVATELRRRSVPAEQIESLLGHRVFKGTSAVYAKYDPNYMGAAKAALSDIWRDWHEAADQWDADHLRTTIGNQKAVIVEKR